MALLRSKKEPEKAPARKAAPVASGPSDVFFGTLRSEFDTPDELGEAFDISHAAFVNLIDAYRNGLISSVEAGAVLTDMIIVDHNGMQWTVGATTLRWHRRLPGGGWRSALPPSGASTPEMLDQAQTLTVLVDTLLHDASARISAPLPAVRPVLDAQELDMREDGTQAPVLYGE